MDHTGSNPGDERLMSWLGQVGWWSEVNPSHKPLTVTLELWTSV